METEVLQVLALNTQYRLKKVSPEERKDFLRILKRRPRTLVEWVSDNFDGLVEGLHRYFDSLGQDFDGELNPDTAPKEIVDFHRRFFADELKPL
jgi:hypothetical protein